MRMRVVPPERTHCRPIRARRAPDAEIDAPGVECCEGAELLRNDERRMIRQHDATSADADARGAFRHEPERDGRRRAGDAREVVVFGHPEALVAPALGVLCEISRTPERLARVAAARDRRQVEDRERNHPRAMRRGLTLRKRCFVRSACAAAQFEGCDPDLKSRKVALGA